MERKAKDLIMAKRNKRKGKVLLSSPYDMRHKEPSDDPQKSFRHYRDDPQKSSRVQTVPEQRVTAAEYYRAPRDWKAEAKRLEDEIKKNLAKYKALKKKK